MAEKKSFLLRLNPKIYQALERWAEDEFRSVNAHIEYLLRDALVRSGRLTNQADYEKSVPEKTANMYRNRE